MQVSGAVNEGSVRVAVPVQIGPQKTLHARDSRKCVDRREGIVSIVAKDDRLTGRAEDQIKVAVSLDIDGPAAGVMTVHDRSGEFGLRCDVSEFIRLVLTKETYAACPGEDQISLEVVIEVDGNNAFRLRRSLCRSPWKGNGRAGCKVHGASVGFDDGRGAFVTQRDARRSRSRRSCLDWAAAQWRMSLRCRRQRE